VKITSFRHSVFGKFIDKNSPNFDSQYDLEAYDIKPYGDKAYLIFYNQEKEPSGNNIVFNELTVEYEKEVKVYFYNHEIKISS